MASKPVGTGSHTFTLDNVKLSKWPQRIQDFYTWIVTKNLVEREKYIILSELTSRFSGILRDWWNSLRIQDKNTFLTSQDFSFNIKILHEVLCGDTGQREENTRRQLFEMNCVSFNRNDIEKHFQKRAKINFEISGYINLKQAFVSSLPKLLASRTMTIIEEKFQSITIPQVGYIRQAIFVALDEIYQDVPATHLGDGEDSGGFKYRTKLIRSNPLGKYLIVGFDIFRQLKDQPQIKANGITFKNQFKPYFEIPRLFQITNDKQMKEIEQNLTEHSCDEFHKDFTKNGKSPLWKNKEFLIKLPFKKNENINPIKASHSGMNPDHFQLAKKELEELLEFDLIEPSDSQWACEAFYINKRSKQTRGKFRVDSQLLKSGFKIKHGKIFGLG
ncbi:uncharacterized protein LOC142176027 [Nicotiana tabacum]|uniref:Uncharacterized protein LOC142176027 n=1 Tax=Nicotiana tabacum TaxID=4097 RepID=A0AC58TPK7_TOBAC